MAVTSSTSAESIGTSSLITFDIYKAYINLKVTTRQMLRISIAGLCIYGTILAAVSCIFHAVGVSLGWLVKIFACLMGGGSFPIAVITLWDGTSTFAAQASPILGLASGLMAWMVIKARSGAINITTTGDSFNLLTGDCVSLGVGLISVVVLSFLYPEKRPFATEGQACDGANSPSVAGVKQLPPSDKDVGKTRSIDEVQQDAGFNAIERYFQPDSEPFVPVSALTKEEANSQKRLALGALAFNIVGLMILLPNDVQSDRPRS